MAREQDIKAIIDLIRPVFHGLYAASEANLRGLSISVPQRGMLQCLLEHGAQTVPMLARRLLVRRQFALRLVNELEAKQLVAREPNPAHKRSHRFGLTEPGSRMITEVLASEASVSALALAQMQDEDIGAAVRVLTAFGAYFGVESRDASE
ncbi:MarR family winged helix-turn-helix transcriptional regulator [Rhizobium sp. FKL33]|uniref:MarR family winged helix-turn-helix transcriptional regulator n=1 Tax=Rhizobium sp. FKL33 TaxID=2562307 RepID=UPI001485130E|nr:MarR family winged helix-turn-helix transcriptional regulator [Rhizobium sp. FKL33]